MAVLAVTVSLVVALLLLAVAALYDRVLQLERGLMREHSGSAIGLQYGERLEHSELAQNFTGFVVLTDSLSDPFSHWFSAHRAAQRWGYPTIVLVVETTGEPDWTSELTQEGAELRVVGPDLLESVLPVELPVTIFCRDGRVLDSARGATTPRLADQHFTLVAAPSLLATEMR